MWLDVLIGAALALASCWLVLIGALLLGRPTGAVGPERSARLRRVLLRTIAVSPGGGGTPHLRPQGAWHLRRRATALRPRQPVRSAVPV